VEHDAGSRYLVVRHAYCFCRVTKLTVVFGTIILFWVQGWRGPQAWWNMMQVAGNLVVRHVNILPRNKTYSRLWSDHSCLGTRVERATGLVEHDVGGRYLVVRHAYCFCRVTKLNSHLWYDHSFPGYRGREGHRPGGT
jgi:hypothetical protein